jgi:hypothetical protein
VSPRGRFSAISFFFSFFFLSFFFWYRRRIDVVYTVINPVRKLRKH